MDGPYSVIIPISAKETDRLARCIIALSDAKIDTPIHPYERFPSGSVLFRAQNDNTLRTIHLNGRQFGMNEVWKGLSAETNVVACTGLADALSWRRSAEVSAHAGQAGESWQSMYLAVERLDKWMASQYRYGTIWDFGALLIRYKVGDKTVALRDVATRDTIEAMKDLSDAMKYDLLCQMWARMANPSFSIEHITPSLDRVVYTQDEVKLGHLDKLMRVPPADEAILKAIEIPPLK